MCNNETTGEAIPGCRAGGAKETEAWLIWKYRRSDGGLEVHLREDRISGYCIVVASAMSRRFHLPPILAHQLEIGLDRDDNELRLFEDLGYIPRWKKVAVGACIFLLQLEHLNSVR